MSWERWSISFLIVWNFDQLWYQHSFCQTLRIPGIPQWDIDVLRTCSQLSFGSHDTLLPLGLIIGSSVTWGIKVDAMLWEEFCLLISVYLGTKMNGSYLAFCYISNAKISFNKCRHRFHLVNMDLLWTFKALLERKWTLRTCFNFTCDSTHFEDESGQNSPGCCFGLLCWLGITL